MNFKIIICIFSLFTFVLLGSPFLIHAVQPGISSKEELLEGVITRLGKGETEIIITDKILKGKKITISNEKITNQVISNSVGDKVIVTHYKNAEGTSVFFISDYVRQTPLLILFLIFLILVVVIGRWRGITSLIGMVISFIIIFQFVLPLISIGNNPVLIVLMSSLLIVPATFYLSHGFNKKTTVAIISTLLSLVVIGILVTVFVNAAKLSGLSTEEAQFLQVMKSDLINIKDLLLAGMMIGILGILDDITISQAAVVFKLKEINKKLSFKDLYEKAMSIGHDHIASLVNTLILVYTGAALPLLLLFINNPKPFGQVINNEIIAVEIVRSLVGSIALILTVPVSTIIAVYAATKE